MIDNFFFEQGNFSGGLLQAGDLPAAHVPRRRLSHRWSVGPVAGAAGPAAETAEYVLEAVTENLDLKKNLFKKLGDTTSPETILATNTSSFFVREFAGQTSRPDQFISLHYFYHPAKNRLLEVIPHKGTSPETLETSLLAAKLHGKTSIVVKDAPGFAVNRFFVPFLNEAARMLEEDMANIPTIEDAAKQAFKIGMGPFELMNVTGIPIAVHASTTLGNEIGPFYATAAILRAKMEKGDLWDLSGDIVRRRHGDRIGAGCGGQHIR